MRIIPGFKFLNTKHCITGSMLHLFHFHNCPISEEMLLGLGSGVGFIYWHPKGDIPFLGGRANTARNKKSTCLEVMAAERCGVTASRITTSSPSKAKKELLKQLVQDVPVMLQIDMGLLPYFPFYGQYHFGYHGVVAAGFDFQTNEITIADRDATPYTVQLTQVSQARNSSFKPFPPKNAWMEYDFCGFHQPGEAAIQQAILECAHDMLHPPIRNIGIRGIMTTKERLLAWPEKMDDKSLASACENVAMYIRADAGTGGGLFRWMYARFLDEAAVILRENNLHIASLDMQAAGDQWELIADIINSVKRPLDLINRQEELSAAFDEVARLEQSTWSRLWETLH